MQSSKEESDRITVNLNLFVLFAYSRPKEISKAPISTSTSTMKTTSRKSENSVMTSSTSSTTTTESSLINVADDTDSDHDHKSVGTSFNTKFYIVPNVTRTEVIKIVESDEDGDEEVLVSAQTVGIAIYVLAAFGLIPLLLALVFAAKFLVQRHRRKVSDYSQKHFSK